MKKRVTKNGIMLDYKTLRKLINPKKVDILEILNQETKINQIELSKKISLSTRQTQRHLDSLKKIGVIKRRAKKRQRGSPVFFSLK